MLEFPTRLPKTHKRTLVLVLFASRSVGAAREISRKLDSQYEVLKSVHENLTPHGACHTAEQHQSTTPCASHVGLHVVGCDQIKALVWLRAEWYNEVELDDSVFL